MIVPNDTLTNKSKSNVIKKKKASKKVIISEKEPPMHAHNIVESMSINEETVSNPIGKDIGHVETMSKGQNMEPYVESTHQIFKHLSQHLINHKLNTHQFQLVNH